MVGLCLRMPQPLSSHFLYPSLYCSGLGSGFIWSIFGSVAPAFFLHSSFIKDLFTVKMFDIDNDDVEMWQSQCLSLNVLILSSNNRS